MPRQGQNSLTWRGLAVCKRVHVKECFQWRQGSDSETVIFKLRLPVALNKISSFLRPSWAQVSNLYAQMRVCRLWRKTRVLQECFSCPLWLSHQPSPGHIDNKASSLRDQTLIVYCRSHRPEGREWLWRAERSNLYSPNMENWSLCRTVLSWLWEVTPAKGVHLCLHACHLGLPKGKDVFCLCLKVRICLFAACVCIYIYIHAYIHHLKETNFKNWKK